MNNFNLDQNPHILSSPEDPERGAGGGNVSEQGEAELSREVLKEQEGDEAITFGLENLDTLITQTVSDLESTEKPNLELDSDTGLSLQGKQIEDLNTQLEALENDESTKLSLSAEIEAKRAQERSVLNTRLKEYKDVIKVTNAKIQAAINQSTKPNLSIEEFLSGNEELQAKVVELEQAIQKGEKAIENFDAETRTQLDQAIQDKKTELQGQLTEAQVGYTESGAEASDKPILLERAKEALEQRLSQTNFTQEVRGKEEFYISDQDLREIFELYGYIDGMERIKKLKKDINVYNGSEQTEKNIQYFAGITKERELGVIRDEKNTLQKELDGIEEDTSYQEASHLERYKEEDNIQLNLLEESIREISCEVRLIDKGFELQEDYQSLLEELSSEFGNSVTSINTELDRLRESISNIKALRNFQIPEGKNLRVDQLKDIEDYLEVNKSKSRWNPSRDQDAISRLSPILENIRRAINERDEYRRQYDLKNSESLNNTNKLRKLSEISPSEYIRGKLGQTELTDKNSITQAISKLREYIEQYQKPDDFDANKERVRELRQGIDTISKQENDLAQYNTRVIYT